MIDEEVGPDPRPRVDVGARPLVGVLGHHARQQRHVPPVERVGDPLQRNHQHARVGKDDFLDAAGGGIALVGSDDVGVDGAADVGKFPEQVHRQCPGGSGGLWVPGEPETLFEFGHEALVDLADPPGGGDGDGVPVERFLVEEPREEQPHEVGTQPVDRFLGRQVGAVEMIDAAIPFVGAEQRGGDVSERLSHEAL